MYKRYVILDNIRSAHNVGAIFRTADGAGVAKIFLCGYTPRPIDRFGRVQAEIKKTSLGASETVAWEAVDEIDDCIDRLQKQHIHIVAIEQAATSIDYRRHHYDQATAFVFGNEVEGVQTSALQASNAILHLPMLGSKESLNVSTTVGIVLYHSLPTE